MRSTTCPASPIHYQFDPVQTTKTSVHGAINMLGLAKRLKIKILQASTDAGVYGQWRPLGVVESIQPQGAFTFTALTSQYKN